MAAVARAADVHDALALRAAEHAVESPVGRVSAVAHVTVSTSILGRNQSQELRSTRRNQNQLRRADRRNQAEPDSRRHRAPR